MSQDIQEITSGSVDILTRRNAMKTGAAVAGGLALAGGASGNVVAVAKDPNEGGSGGSTSPVDMFLKLDGIDGEGAAREHRGEIEVLSWSWGASQSGSLHRGRGGGAGKVDIQDLVILKSVDKATPKLYQACATGRHIPSGKLTLRKAGGDEAIEYLTIDFETTLITSVDFGGSVGESQTETITLNFAEFRMTYTEQEADGSAGEETSFGWDIQRNVET